MGAGVTGENDIIQLLKRIRGSLQDTHISVGGSLSETQLILDATIENERQYLTDSGLQPLLTDQGGLVTHPDKRTLSGQLDDLLNAENNMYNQYILDTMPGHAVLRKLIDAGQQVSIDAGIFASMNIDE